MMSLQVANCSMFVPWRRKTLGRRQQSHRQDVQCRRRPQALSTGNPGDRLKGVGQVSRSKSTDAGKKMQMAAQYKAER